ncbi:MAG: hypothetical protein F4X81_09490 [Gammaproteobacteria bacterium]|nr:hypothetical protein [Gammaproteobacteria bacterium]MYE51690.1 hypothetical protein [Gammaproteobacteria bacterium]MYF10944.1 hypothetical protein [Gammaproteobacteria bacterium]MYH17356.1 hypothetical protein [Gammaproteobacteria bacterium]MYK84635.1 hypothetical protein [Gammaproteobacteria bacterium]
MSERISGDVFGKLYSPPIASNLQIPTSIENSAKWMHERVVRSINSFEEQLDQEHEVGARLVNFGLEMTFHIEDVGYWGPDIITFYGMDQEGNNVELLQHISQLSVLLVALKKVRDEPRRIGFALMESVEND